MTATRSPARHRFRLVVVLTSVVAAMVGSGVLATQHSGEDVTTRGVTATFPVPGHPGSVAAGRDALWVALSDLRTTVTDEPLLRLDVASGTVAQRILLGGRATYLTHVGSRLLASVEHNGGSGSGPSLIVSLDWRDGRVLARRQFPLLVGPLAVSGQALWALQIRPAALLRLDPLTLRPIAAPLQLSQGPAAGLAVGGAYVWVTVPDAGDVLRIDAAGSIRRVHVGGAPVGIAFGAESVWFAGRDSGELGRLDPKTLHPIGKSIHIGGRPTTIAKSGPYLFVGDAMRGIVRKIDLHTGRTAGPPIRVARPAEGATGLAVAPEEASVWVSSFASRTVTRVTATSAGAQPPAVIASSGGAAARGRALPRAGDVVASIPVPPELGAFTVGEGAVWAVSDATSELIRIDPARNAIVGRIKLSPAEAAAAGAGAVWVTHPEEDTVSRIDPKTNAVSATIHVPSHPSGIAVSGGTVWVGDVLGPSVTRIDPATNRIVATVRVGPNRFCCSQHMNVIADGQAVWAALSAGNTLVRVDPRTDKLTASIKLGLYVPCGFLLAAAGAVWSTGGACSDAVVRIDPYAKRVTAKVAEPHPVGVVLAYGSIWVASVDSGDVDRIDPRTGHATARVHVGGYPVRLAYGFGSVWVNDDKGRVLRIQPQK